MLPHCVWRWFSAHIGSCVAAQKCVAAVMRFEKCEYTCDGDGEADGGLLWYSILYSALHSAVTNVVS
jgi:hypothetical protein